MLTMGDRPAELLRAVESVLAQEGDPVEVVVIGNGAEVPPVPAPARVERLSENIGIPGGRNRGVDATSGDVVMFLDDDGWWPDRHLAEHVRDLFAADPRLGVVSFRVKDPDGGPGERRHVPRLRAGDPGRSSEVTTFLGGACAIRREVFRAVGPFPERFFYAHEETDFAWRAIDAGYRIRYDADSQMCHPALPPSRHGVFYRLNARNRVWLARRNLPWPLAVVYLADWMVLTVLRVRSRRGLAEWFRGFREGWATSCGVRRPIRWGTAVRMARAGRPPVV